jgi:hypothetical protein
MELLDNAVAFLDAEVAQDLVEQRCPWKVAGIIAAGRLTRVKKEDALLVADEKDADGKRFGPLSVTERIQAANERKARAWL